jgi:hypothetical protein
MTSITVDADILYIYNILVVVSGIGRPAASSEKKSWCRGADLVTAFVGSKPTDHTNSYAKYENITIRKQLCQTQ